MPDYDMSIHTNPDAMAWAKFYTECRNKSPNPANYDDEGMMVTWFANAMMAMHDHMRPDLAPVMLPDGSAICVGAV